MKYLLTFKPLKHFFFGNNKTFSDDYLAVSEYFPQNTQLLGALRLFIAEQQGLMKVYKSGKWCDKPEELKLLTGTATSKDFMINNDLGKIINLSQIFIVKSSLEDAYFPTPFDIEISKNEIKYYELSNIDSEYYLKNYDVKSSSKQHLGNKTFWKKYLTKESLSLDDIEQFDYEKEEKKGVFMQHSQVGIELDNKQTVDEKFYSKTDYQLSDGYLFACVIELEEDILEDGIIQIGAESSLFELKKVKLEDTELTQHPIVSNLFKVPQRGEKIIWISDAIVDNTNDLNAKFSIFPYYKNFAMIRTDDRSFEKKSSKSKNNSKFKGKTEQKRVVPAGSVFYLKDMYIPDNNIGAYSKMGFNQFISVKN